MIFMEVRERVREAVPADRKPAMFEVSVHWERTPSSERSLS